MLILHKANTLHDDQILNYLQSNIGIEIDLRDHLNQLIINHNPVSKTCKVILLQKFLSLYQDSGSNAVIALNIKSCGLQHMLKDLLEEYKIKNYFVFDMAIPDSLDYIKNDIKFFTRQSEFEKVPIFYKEADGVWLDEFKSHWINEEIIMNHIHNGKKIAIVSPELHGRSYTDEWKNYKKIMKKNNLDDKIMICTDFPLKFQS